MTAAGNAASAPATALPDGLEHYRSTPVFTETTLPAGLRTDHSTKDGTWGLIRVISGTLRYRITDERRSATELLLSPGDTRGVIEPTIRHNVEPVGEVRFFVEFHR